jgi:hypothetical protein
MTIGESVADAFERTWIMYRSAVNDIPEEHWRAGDVDYLIPARQVYHVIEAAEYYSGATPKGFPWGQRFGTNWEHGAPEELPTREQILEYLDEIQERVDTWLRRLKDPELLSPDPEFLWPDSSFLDRALYLLMHNRQHIGELNAELRHRELKRIHWR